MRKEITVDIHGKIAPKERPRLGSHGKFYTPLKTKESETRIAWCARKAMTGKNIFTCYVGVQINLWIKDKKGLKDIDNIAKTILDGMNKIVYQDDRQVLKLEVAIKPNSEEEKAKVSIYEIYDLETGGPTAA